MTYQKTSHKTLAPLRNVAALAALIDRCQNRQLGQPGMATFYGFSGLGKSEAATYARNAFQALYVEVGESWTKKTLCDRIIREIGGKPKGNVSDMIEQISEYLAIHDVPLIIDDAQFLLKRGIIENVREIYQSSDAVIILIGEEELPQRLREIERVHGRMLDWVVAQFATLEDIGHLAPIYADGVTIDQELQAKLLKESHGSIRRICVNLGKIRELAQMEGYQSVGLKEWGKTPFFTGEAPTPRSAI